MAALVILVILKQWDERLRKIIRVPIPAELLVIAVGIAAVYGFSLDGMGVKGRGGWRRGGVVANLASKLAFDLEWVCV